MGGGNGQKSAAARDRNNAKKAKDAKAKNAPEIRAKMEADRTAVKCKICMMTFMINVGRNQLNDHWVSKHQDKGFALEQAFPNLAAASAGRPFSNSRRVTMGGGNGQKSATARERNNAKKAKDAKLKNAPEMRAKMEADRTAVKCKICMMTFMVNVGVRRVLMSFNERSNVMLNVKRNQLNDHWVSKHQDKGFAFEQCFPHLAA
ncbi:hypothetical protein DYB28_001334 [Aphanomyces astaci]|uniref:At2g23090-like zinc-binding domain-containing protein n=1 Tax=Aphanomyces astaci TaxID=112090 RepID=A0A9X8DLF4_APHAT|nr:hypothetical protein DYB28_001334 [Aphanomyces astaci]